MIRVIPVFLFSVGSLANIPEGTTPHPAVGAVGAVWGVGGPFVAVPGVLDFSGQLIVRPLAGLSPQADRAARDRLAPSTMKFYPEVDEYIVSCPASPDVPGAAPGQAENALAADLLATGLYEYAHPNWIVHPADLIPDDPWYPQQWHHTTMGSPAAWSLSTGDPGRIIAFTDTGIDILHPDLAPHRVPGFDAFLDLAETSGGAVIDLNGHGTHVAGCAAAIGDNAAGVAGVDWNARIMAVRVTFGAGGGAYIDDVMQGARWAADHGASIVSTSFSGVDYATVQTTGAYLRQRGALYFYAAGNDSRNLSGVDWPDVIVVGASTRTDARLAMSAYGRAVDCFAPGEAIVSTVLGGGYQAWTGTSMAAPVAAGAASLLWSINPALTPDQVQQILLDSCTDLGAPGDDDVFGHGRINLRAGAAAALRSRPCPPDFNADGFLDFFDLDAFVECFETGACPPGGGGGGGGGGGRTADFNADSFVDFFDYDAFIAAYEAGC